MVRIAIVAAKYAVTAILRLKNGGKSVKLFKVNLFRGISLVARKRIDEHSLQVLEFDQVRRILAAYASSSLGRRAALELYPSVDLDWVTCRMAEMTELKGLLDRQVALPLAGLRDIGELIREYGRGKTVFEPSQLLEIADTLSASGTVKKFLKELPDEQAANLKLMAEKLLDFAPIVDDINRCIEDDKTVRSDASDKLKEIRRSIAGLSAQIGQRFKRIVSSPELRKAIENDKPLTRHGRVVVALKTRYRPLC
jgi:DNA mismatch repair protein MutS2